jgi:hypothetical protein
LERTLQVLNELEQSGLLDRYAIGGAMAALFYTEPILTYDLDVFALLPTTASGLITLQPLYDELRKRGYQCDGEAIVIEEVPVQFLPAHNSLLEEALTLAQEVDYGATKTRVLRAEHLMAIMLQTGRDKDRLRFDLFRREVSLDLTLLHDLVERFGLGARWTQWTT